MARQLRRSYYVDLPAAAELLRCPASCGGVSTLNWRLRRSHYAAGSGGVIMLQAFIADCSSHLRGRPHIHVGTTQSHKRRVGGSSSASHDPAAELLRGLCALQMLAATAKSFGHAQTCGGYKRRRLSMFQLTVALPPVTLEVVSSE